MKRAKSNQRLNAQSLNLKDLISESVIRRARDNQLDPFFIGNKALYDLCKQYPDHTNASEIISKIWLIGRTYAAAIERRRPRPELPSVSGDSFYIDCVAPAVISADVDARLATLRGHDDPSAARLKVLSVHSYLVNVFFGFTGLNKRSLASKYLHFHFPKIVFLYDDRAVKALAFLRAKLSIATPAIPANSDPSYGSFVTTALVLRDMIRREHGEILTPREVDRVLLVTAARLGF